MSRLSLCLVLVVSAAVSVTAYCPHYMHDPSKAEAKKLQPVGDQMFMFIPQTIDKKLPQQVYDLAAFNATMVPTCTSVVANRWTANYTLSNKKYSKYVEIQNQQDPKTCKKFNTAEMYLQPKYFVNSTVAVPLTCAGPWRSNTTNAVDTVLQNDLMLQLFSQFFQPITKKSPVLRKGFNCKVAAKYVKFSKMGACIKKPGQSLTIEKLKYGAKDDVAASWANVEYACEVNKPRFIFLRAVMPYTTACAWNPSVSPNLV